MNRQKSASAFQIAKKLMPGGVNSPVRAFQSVGGNPLFINRGDGPYMFDIDGNRYIDFCASWGPLILGHANHAVIEKVQKTLRSGTSFGAPNILEIELASKIIKHIPSIEKMRFVNSGTEAVMSAIRLARGFTGRDLIVKFDGCYHGHVDYLLTAAGSGVINIPQASSLGIPADFIKNTISVPFNDFEMIENVFNNHPGKIAAVIVEPVPGNMGVINSTPGFLTLLRELTRNNGSLLIFDEVISGFRVGIGGAQELFNIKPDLTTLGKIIGGGFPVGAYGGRKEIVDLIAPLGNVYQAGTLSGNPVSMAAGIATLEILEQENFYKNLNSNAEYFYKLIEPFLSNLNIQLACCKSMFTIFFSDKKPVNFEDTKRCDIEKFSCFHNLLLENGVYFSPSQFETNFISSSHAKSDLEIAAEKIKCIVRDLSSRKACVILVL